MTAPRVPEVVQVTYQVLTAQQAMNPPEVLTMMHRLRKLLGRCVRTRSKVGTIGHPKKKNVVVSVQKVENRTTIMLRNLPSSFTRSQLLDILDGKGLCRKYDFVYLPIDFVSGASLGYAFVNLIDTDIANCAMQCLDGFSAWAGTTSQKVMGACWSDPHQGLSMLVERFRNSRVMHPIIPDEYRPALFNEGKRLPFPKHTKRIRPPYSGSVQARLSAA